MNLRLIEVSVLISVGWAAALFFVVRRWLRQRQAWQWWHQQQMLQRHYQAESIRDGLLQQTFAFRRYLEGMPQSEAEPATRWLDRFQTYYQSLEGLSNQLSPPFVADSLPLALQFALKDWQRSHPALQLQLDLPTDWPSGSPSQNQTVLSVTMALLRLLTAEATPQRLTLALSREASQHRLIFELAETAAADASAARIRHLKEIFRSLAAGQLDVSRQGATQVGRLCWRDE
ncbi:MAG: hypothetical protein F6J97_12030 [Leptolyngbya sp. SIO4C1]|nr:hypothetical protein [Leptolyngbya sp. SIO4C1]